MPSSCSASSTTGCVAVPGALPAERASWRPSTARRKSRSAITLRPLFATQTKRTFVIRPCRCGVRAGISAQQGLRLRLPGNHPSSQVSQRPGRVDAGERGTRYRWVHRPESRDRTKLSPLGAAAHAPAGSQAPAPYSPQPSTLRHSPASNSTASHTQECLWWLIRMHIDWQLSAYSSQKSRPLCRQRKYFVPELMG